MRCSENVTLAHDPGAGLCHKRTAHKDSSELEWAARKHGQSLKAESQVLADLPFSLLGLSCRCMGPDFRELELELVSEIAVAQRKLQAGPAMLYVYDRKPATCAVAVHCKPLQNNSRRNSLAPVRHLEFGAQQVGTVHMTQAHAWAQA